MINIVHLAVVNQEVQYKINMKKLKSWLVIILCSLFLLLFVLVFIILIPEMLGSDGVKTNMSAKEAATSIVGFVVLIILLIIGLRYGIKGLRKKNAVEIIEFIDVLNIHFTGKIAYADYKKLILNRTFRKPVYLVLIGITVLYTVSLTVSGADVWDTLTSNYIPGVYIGLFIFVPITTIIQIKKIYKTNKIFQETLTYNLNNTAIHIKGATIDSTQNWAHFFKIVETKEFFMLYQGEAVATLLDKKMFVPNDVPTFQRFIKSLNVIKE
jgi:hypothetical protein